jgi:hypothetical protein
MLIEATNATTELLALCNEHGQREAASLELILIAARRAQALLARVLRELGAQAVVEEELEELNASFYRLLDLLERMEEEPRRSYRAELVADCAQLQPINEAMRELLEHGAVVQRQPELVASVVLAAAVLHALRKIARHREHAQAHWPELPAMDVIGETHFDKLTDLALAELRVRSDARFALKRWRAAAAGAAPRCGYVFENRRFLPSMAAVAAGDDPVRLSREAMAEHQGRAYSSFPGVTPIQLVLGELRLIAQGRRVAA